MADVKAKAKWCSYDASLASQANGGRGRLCDGKSSPIAADVKKAAWHVRRSYIQQPHHFHASGFVSIVREHLELVVARDEHKPRKLRVHMCNDYGCFRRRGSLARLDSTR